LALLFSSDVFEDQLRHEDHLVSLCLAMIGEILIVANLCHIVAHISLSFCRNPTISGLEMRFSVMTVQHSLVYRLAVNAVLPEKLAHVGDGVSVRNREPAIPRDASENQRRCKMGGVMLGRPRCVERL